MIFNFFYWIKGIGLFSRGFYGKMIYNFFYLELGYFLKIGNMKEIVNLDYKKLNYIKVY